MNTVTIFTTRSGSTYTLDTLTDGTEVVTITRPAGHPLARFETYPVQSRTEIVLGANVHIVEQPTGHSGTGPSITTTAVASITQVMPPLGRPFTSVTECARHRLAGQRQVALSEFSREVGRKIDEDLHADAMKGVFMPRRNALI